MDIECPYCQEDQDINHDDGYGFEEDTVFRQTCRYCDKTFVYSTGTLFVYYPEKADCLNDAEHNYKLTTTYPKEYSMMRCTMCDEERKPTNEEREEYGLDKESL